MAETRAMKCAVFGRCQELKVFQAVIEGIAVLVVDYVPPRDRSYVSLPNDTMNELIVELEIRRAAATPRPRFGVC